MKIVITGKDPDLLYSLKLTEKQYDRVKKYFKFGEYYEIELDVDQRLNILGGRFLPIGE